MRLESCFLFNLLAVTYACLAHAHPNNLSRRQSRYNQLVGERTIKREAVEDLMGLEVEMGRARKQPVVKRDGDVYGVPNGVWPTIAVPPGYTLAAGVELTPLAAFATHTVTSTNSAAPTSTSQGTATALGDNSNSYNSVINSTSVINDLDNWDRESSEACTTAMINLKGKADNPTGLVICYNIPYLDVAKGIFEAELRLYNVSAPSAPWTNVPGSAMTVSLSFDGATITRSDGKDIPSKRDAMLVSGTEEKRLADVFKRDGQSFATTIISAPTSTTAAAASSSMTVAGQRGAILDGVIIPLEISNPRIYVGKINANLMSGGDVTTTGLVNATLLQTLLTPQVLITAPNPDTSSSSTTNNNNDDLTASLSPTDASFLLGAFSRSSPASSSSSSASASTSSLSFSSTNLLSQTLALNSTLLPIPTPFIVPGTRLGVTPIGLVVTSVWSLIFLLSWGLGTIGRIRSRDVYRTEMKKEREWNGNGNGNGGFGMRRF